jgi:hypothetical protein
MKDIADRNNVPGVTAARIFDHINYSDSFLTEILSFDEFKGNAGDEKYKFIR